MGLFGPCWSILAILRPSWTVLGPSGTVLGPSGAVLGPIALEISIIFHHVSRHSEVLQNLHHGNARTIIHSANHKDSHQNDGFCSIAFCKKSTDGVFCEKTFVGAISDCEKGEQWQQAVQLFERMLG